MQKVLKLIVKTIPDCFIGVFEAGMVEGVFPNQWRRLVLLPMVNKCCTVITLVVKNASNSANLECIKSSVAKMGVPSCLTKLPESYLSKRTLWYETDTTSQQYIVTAGKPHRLSVRSSAVKSDI